MAGLVRFEFPFWFYCAAFAAGSGWLQTQERLPDAAWLWILPLAAGVLLVPRARRQGYELARQGGVLLLVGALGFAYTAWRAEQRLAERLPAAAEGSDVGLAGRVSGLPQDTPWGQVFDFDLAAGQALGLRRVRLSWYAPRDVEPAPRPFRAGQEWQLTARLKQPHGQLNFTGFDYEAWLLQHAIGATGYVRAQPAPQLLASQGAGFLAALDATRERVRKRILAVLGEAPYAGVVAALVVGDQQAIPPWQWRDFNRTGVTHLMSISGLHVTLLAGLAAALAAWGWRRVPALALRWPAHKVAVVVGFASALAYSLLAGFQIPAQRTLFMLAAVAAGLLLARRPPAFSLLGMSLLVVCLFDPWATLAAGFWLSFGAVAALLWVSEGRVGRLAALKGWVLAQAAVTLALAPALLMLFQQVSLVSPLANALAIPLVSWVITPLALAGGLVPGLSASLQWAQQLMAWQGGLLHVLADWPVLVRPQPHAPALVAALAGVLWLLLPRGMPARWLGALLLMPLLWPEEERLPQGHFAATVLDVGQGTAVLVQTAHHRLLYDSGPSYGESDAGERVVLPALRAAGALHLDGLVLSHNDSDHTGGAASVLRDADAGWLLTSVPVQAQGAWPAPRRLACVRGQHWRWDGVDFAVLNPPSQAYREARSDNAMSCVVKISSGGQALLLTGDAEQRAEGEMAAQLPARLASSVLLAGHHGSATSTTPAFLAAVRPARVIFSAGYRNRYGHPHWRVVGDVRRAGAAMHRTDRDGALRLDFAPAGVAVASAAERRRRYWQLGR